MATPCHRKLLTFPEINNVLIDSLNVVALIEVGKRRLQKISPDRNLAKFEKLVSRGYILSNSINCFPRDIEN